MSGSDAARIALLEARLDELDGKIDALARLTTDQANAQADMLAGTAELALTATKVAASANYLAEKHVAHMSCLILMFANGPQAAARLLREFAGMVEDSGNDDARERLGALAEMVRAEAGRLLAR